MNKKALSWGRGTRRMARGFRAATSPLLAMFVLASCSADDPAVDAVERKLAVTVTLGEFDVERGQIMSSTVHVVVDGFLYPLALAEGTTFLDLGDVTRIELGGRRALIAGAIVNGAFEATYARLLPDTKPQRMEDADPLVGPLENLKHELMDLEREQMELNLERLQLPQTEIEARTALEAKIGVAEAKLDELRKQYRAKLSEIKRDP